MKKIFVLIFSVLLLAVASCSTQATRTNDPPGEKVQYADDQHYVGTTDVTAPVVYIQNAEQPPGESDKTFLQILKENWVALLLGFFGFLELIVRLTPTEKDNSILNMIVKFLNVIIPNLKKGGGTFVLKTG